MIVDLSTGGASLLSLLRPKRILKEPNARPKLRGAFRDIPRGRLSDHQGLSDERIPPRDLLSSAESLASVVESQDPYTASHQRRVARLAAAIAREMGLSPQLVEEIYLAGLVHDVGKIFLPPEILGKPGCLSPEQMAIIKTHPRTGCESLTSLGFSGSVAEVVLQHHERLDGSGYPQGLTADTITVPARVVAVADVVGAAASDRPYRPARSMTQVLDAVLQDQGMLYDREAVHAFRTLVTIKGYNLGSE